MALRAEPLSSNFGYRSKEVELEAFGMNYDPKTTWIGVALGVVEIIDWVGYMR
jgi:hypothetical protein